MSNATTASESGSGSRTVSSVSSAGSLPGQCIVSAAAYAISSQPDAQMFLQTEDYVSNNLSSQNSKMA